MSVATSGLSLVAVNRGYSSLQCTGFLVVEQGLQAHWLQ